MTDFLVTCLIPAAYLLIGCALVQLACKVLERRR